MEKDVIKLAKEIKNTYNRALFIVSYFHDNQVDKVGENYLFHLLAVSNQLKDDNKIIGLLHDILEDTNCTLEILKELFNDNIANNVFLLTHQKNMTRKDYLINVKKSKNAIIVKCSDLLHNCDLKRFDNSKINISKEFKEKMYQKRERYFKDMEFLVGKELTEQINYYGVGVLL